MTDSEHANLSDLTLDTANLNSHTKRGHDLTRRSVSRFGSRLAGVIDKNGIVIDGNDRADIYNDTGMDKVMIVKGDPNVPIYIQYDDLDLRDSDNPARELQLGLHRSAIESFEIDPEMLAIHLLENESVATDWYFDSELEEELKKLELEVDFGIAGYDGDESESSVNNSEQLLPSHVRMLQLFLNTETFPLLMSMIAELHSVFDTDNNTDCVFKAMKYARDTLTRK